MKTEEEIRAKIEFIKNKIIKDINSPNCTVQFLQYEAANITALEWVLGEE